MQLSTSRTIGRRQDINWQGPIATTTITTIMKSGSVAGKVFIHLRLTPHPSSRCDVHTCEQSSQMIKT